MNTQDRYVSSRVVLGRVSRMMEDSNWRDDGLMYLLDGIQRYGYNWVTDVDITPEDELLTVENHTVEIPCYVEEILHVYYNGNKIPINIDNSMLALSKDDYKWQGEDHWYMVQYPYIKTSFESGNIKLYSKKFITDKEGFVLIPDHQQYKYALRWFIVYNLLLSGYSVKNKQIDLDFAKFELEQSESEATVGLKVLGKDRREQLSRMINSINTAHIGRFNLMI